jgi:hypothetical protein
MGKIRGTHSSPGVYTEITDLNYAAKSLGITTLGLVGETKKGPAFEPIAISNWSEFKDYFGDVSAEKFKDSQYPKYELPYIAKSYLSASDQLYVCRVLGLSGYNAGPAFLITAQKEDDDTKKYVVGVLRARGHYDKYAKHGDICNGGYTTYDTLSFDCDTVKITPYTSVYIITQCETSVSGETADSVDITQYNMGQFTIEAYKDGELVGKYPVSLNAGSKDYIYNVLGSTPTEGSAAVFVEELYDVRLNELIANGTVDIISSGTVAMGRDVSLNAVHNPVSDFAELPYHKLTKKNLGLTYLCVSGGSEDLMYMKNDGDGSINPESRLYSMERGGLYTVASYVTSAGTKSYCYMNLVNDNGNSLKIGKEVVTSGNTATSSVDVVKVLAYDTLFQLDDGGNVIPTTNISDYHEQFRCASTPWIVSELKGDGENIEVKKLFRFHTITDGTGANSQIKISIANIEPNEGTFDVLIRDFNDSDASPSILEQYKNVNLIPGNSKYLGLKIGTLDGSYETVSKYVLVEIIENDMTQNCVPCGFLGYPVRDYSMIGNNIVAPTFTYNTSYNEDIKDKRQYFGMGDIDGVSSVDVDMLYYKGKNAYTEDYRYGYTHPFHLDSTLNKTILDDLKNGGHPVTVTVDGDQDTASLVWDTVSPDYDPTEFEGAPVIGDETDMEGTLYEKVALRKFTVYPCGGFDGWDIYRGSRTNTDEFKASKYKGTISNGMGATFSKISNADTLALDAGAITSDYYAYLAGINQFEIPERTVINLFATPGIDYVNNTLLSNDALDMIEEKRGDTFYVMTTPDKPWGASDARDEMYSSADAAENLADTGIDTIYASTYYPWIKYYDKTNSIYVNLPATKDVLRNLANIDNKKYPWYAPAGIERGDVECTKMHFFAKLEDEDTLYDANINPLKTFSEDGVKVWGNKTMTQRDSPLNRINTVRLMLYLRKLVVAASRKLVFEPNDTTLKTQLEGIINPILAQIKSDRGLTDYRVVVSQTTEQMDAHEVSASIYVKATPSMEYLEISFVATPQGVSFDDI